MYSFESFHWLFSDLYSLVFRTVSSQLNQIHQRNTKQLTVNSPLDKIKAHLERGIAEFFNRIHPRHLPLFLELAEAQQPHTFFISCSDSRLVGTVLTRTNPGELFELENAGQIIFPSQQKDLSSQATIEYALAVLKIKNIVVCGHSDCGAVKALLKKNTVAKSEDSAECSEHQLSAIDAYLQSAYPQGFFKEKEPLCDSVKRHVRKQCENLLSYPNIKAAIDERSLNIEGWYYDVKAGKVEKVIEYTELNSSLLQKH